MKNGKLKFVVHEHHASTLHWDFRLQIGKVLRSWAVPKGPPLDEGVKRLAVITEDHALEYGEFEGVIEEGSYGAGEVRIWDSGTYEMEEDEEEKGKLVFVLSGKKMSGRYCLIRLKDGKNWILFKTKEMEKA
ncbi:MAG: DNA polymerase ligase N-terminal domain-containing protein [Candidatus Micrarchaeia archaeon]|jgi:bifunctional non-homologous end joining protein LigD